MDHYQLGQVLIVAPDVPFARVDEALKAIGFSRAPATTGAPPIVALEPELAAWSWQGRKPRVTYTFNPVVRLRVLDVATVPPSLRGAIAARLTLTSPEVVGALVAAADRRDRLRGLWIAGECERLDLAPAVAEAAARGDALVAQAAEKVAGRLRSIGEARQRLGPMLAALVASAEPVVRGLTDPTSVAGVRPRAGDAARLFDADLAAAIEPLFDDLWSVPPLANPGARLDLLELTAAPAGLLRSPNELSDRFPRGYRDIAGWMNPSGTWITWAWAGARGASVRFDGLAWVDDHWCWMPKVFLVVQGLLARNRAGARLD